MLHVFSQFGKEMEKWKVKKSPYLSKPLNCILLALLRFCENMFFANKRSACVLITDSRIYQENT